MKNILFFMGCIMCLNSVAFTTKADVNIFNGNTVMPINVGYTECVYFNKIPCTSQEMSVQPNGSYPLEVDGIAPLIRIDYIKFSSDQEENAF